MKEWLRYFRIWFILLGIVTVVFCVVCGSRLLGGTEADSSSARVNNICTETERVFDYADVLSDEEEESLRKLIAKKEVQSKCDIILLTMNESLEEYALSYDSTAYGNDYTMIYADNFYDENGFGWNKYVEADDGDGVILVDNWYRESDGKVYSWLSTSGSVQTAYSTSMIDSLLDRVYEEIDTDPYKAYKAYIETISQDMSYAYGNEAPFPWYLVALVTIVIAVIFIVVNYSGKEGKKTTAANTYVNGGKPDFRTATDLFIRKTVSQRKIQRSDSSGGGGGGSHTSAGGHSHGGGGHSR